MIIVKEKEKQHNLKYKGRDSEVRREPPWSRDSETSYFADS